MNKLRLRQNRAKLRLRLRPSGSGAQHYLEYWPSSPMLCPLSYAVKPVGVQDNSELNSLIFLILSNHRTNHDFLCVLVLCTLVKMMFLFSCPFIQHSKDHRFSSLSLVSCIFQLCGYKLRVTSQTSSEYKQIMDEIYFDLSFSKGQHGASQSLYI